MPIRPNRHDPAAGACSGPAPNCSAECHAIVLLPTRCERCGCAAQAAAFWLPPGHSLRVEGEHPDADAWQESDDCRLLLAVSWIDADTRRWLARWLPALRPVAQVHCATAWLHHCAHCGAAVPSPEATPDGDGAWWVGALSGAVTDIYPVSGPVRAVARSWAIGDLAESVLDAIAHQAQAEALGDRGHR